MATRAEVEQERSTQSDIGVLAVAELVAFWESLNLSLDPGKIAAQVVDFLPQLVATHGASSAASAAAFYDELRTGDRLTSRFVASPSERDRTDAVVKSAQWAITPLFPSDRAVFDEDGNVIRRESIDPNPDKALDRLAATTQRHVAQHGRDTIAENADADPADAKWARVPTGEETCAWCRILASRGAVYETEQSAKFIGTSKGKYHDWCDCQPIVVWRDADWPEGYDPDAFMQQYENAKAESASGDIKAIAATMREQLGVK